MNASQPSVTVAPTTAGDGISVVPVTDLSVPALQDELVRLAGHLAAGVARFLDLLAALDQADGWVGHGMASLSHWLAWRCGMSQTTAREHVRVARALTELPATRSSFLAGELTFSKVRALTRAATPSTEVELVDTAKACTASQLDRLCAGIHRVRSDGEVLDQRARATLTTRWRDDGMLAVSARLAPEDGAVLLTALAALRPDAVLPDGAASGEATSAAVVAAAVPAAAEPQPPLSEPRADRAEFAARNDAQALVALARHALEQPPAAAGSSPIRLVIHALAPATVASAPHAVPAASAEAPPGCGPTPADGADRPASAPDNPCTDDGRQTTAPAASAEAAAAATPHSREPAPLLAGVLDAGPAVPLLPLSPTTLQRLACEATIEPARHPDDPDAVAAQVRHGRRRFASTRQRRALLRRDGGCCFPGCTRRRGLHAHHVVHHARGGATTMTNLALLCEHHHLLVHEGGWSLRRSTAGWTAAGPLGQTLPATVTSAGNPAAVTTAYAPLVRADAAAGAWAGDPLRLGYAVSVFTQAAGRAA